MKEKNWLSPPNSLETNKKSLLAVLIFRFCSLLLAYLITHFGFSPLEKTQIFDLLWYLTLTYNIILLIKLNYLARTFHHAYFFWLTDLFFSAFLLLLTKGWGSPFFVYTFSVLMIFARYSSWKVSFLVLLLWSVLYYLTLIINGYTPAKIIKLKEFDILMAHFFDFIAVLSIITFLSKVLDQSDRQKEAIKSKERKLEKAYQKIAQSLSQLSTLQKITSSILAQTEIKEIVKNTLSFLESLGFLRAALGLIEGESIFRWFQSGELKTSAEKIPLIKIGNQTALGLALQKKEMIVVAPHKPLAEEVQKLIGYPSRSDFAFVPLIIENEAKGALLVEARENKPFSQEELELLKTFAEQISLAFFHNLSYEKIRKSAVSEERNKMAIELHDSVVQELYGLNCLLGSLNLDNREELKEKIGLAKEIVTRSLKNLRLAVLDWESLSWQEGLFTLVEKYTSSFEKNTGIETELILPPRPPKLPPSVQRHLFRIVQESYHNIFKHAQAKKIVLTMDYHKKNKYFYLKIKDDGAGFSLRDIRKKTEVKGLRNMRERAREIKANLRIKTKPGQGCEIKVELPWVTRKK